MKIVIKILICFFILLPMTFAGGRSQMNSDKFFIEALSTQVDSSVVIQTKEKLPEKKLTSFIVTAAMYTVDSVSKHLALTADGTKINRKNPGGDRIVAVSWDLKKSFKYGEKVLIEGIGKYSGIYTVRDLMHSRWTNKIDILRNMDDNLRMYYHVKMSKLK